MTSKYKFAVLQPLYNCGVQIFRQAHAMRANSTKVKCWVTLAFLAIIKRTFPTLCLHSSKTGRRYTACHEVRMNHFGDINFTKTNKHGTIREAARFRKRSYRCHGSPGPFGYQPDDQSGMLVSFLAKFFATCS